MKISLTGQRGSLLTGPLETTDERFDDADAALGSVLDDLESLGLLEAIDLMRVKAILQKYTSGGFTNSLGVTRAGDAADATDATDVARRQAAVVARNVEHIQGIAKNYKAFWDRNAEENARSIRR